MSFQRKITKITNKRPNSPIQKNYKKTYEKNFFVLFLKRTKKCVMNIIIALFLCKKGGKYGKKITKK